MLKAAIIGCGKIADAHAAGIRKLKACRLVGACDTEILMARQLADRFDIENAFDSVPQMLARCTPDVVHITTPPQFHHEIARRCLESGCHIYVEKPFGLNFAEAESIIDTAVRNNRKLTVGHDLQFSSAARRLRQAVREGYLGGPVLHMESYYSYDLSNEVYARALLADEQHWVRRLPGKLLHNIINHGIARIAEYLDAEEPTIITHGFTSPLLSRLGERAIVDELRAVISDGRRTTAYFTFSSQMRPSLNHFRIYGPENGLESDDNQQTLIRWPGKRYKSYLEKFVPPFNTAGQYLGNLKYNIHKFLANDFHMKSGMHFLIRAFYNAVAHDEAPPIPYREILLTSKIMERMFEQIYAAPEPGERRVPGPATTGLAVRPSDPDLTLIN